MFSAFLVSLLNILFRLLIIILNKGTRKRHRTARNLGNEKVVSSISAVKHACFNFEFVKQPILKLINHVTFHLHSFSWPHLVNHFLKVNQFNKLPKIAQISLIKGRNLCQINQRKARLFIKKNLQLTLKRPRFVISPYNLKLEWRCNGSWSKLNKLYFKICYPTTAVMLVIV